MATKLSKYGLMAIELAIGERREKALRIVDETENLEEADYWMDALQDCAEVLAWVEGEKCLL